MKYVLFNPLSNNNNGEIALKEALSLIKEETIVKSLIDLDKKAFFNDLKPDDEVILVGGDGTLNKLINDLNGQVPMNNIYLYSAGTGNDFLKDVNVNNEKFFLVNKYLENLPKVTVNGQSYFFINGIGYGIDGYCCEVGDKLKAKSKKKINYTSIAIKGLLFHFKTVKATVIIDGTEYNHEHVWLAPTMKGRYYGGGMMVAPSQNRLNEEKLLSHVIFKGKSKLKTLMVFPSIFKGEHIKHSEMVKIVTGKKIKVMFNRPTALQIDGETILNVTSYEAEI